MQKTPILRVFADGGSYYVDEQGHAMAVSSRYAAYLPVACGKIEKTFATTDLYKFAVFLHKHDFWNNQIEHHLQLFYEQAIPKVGWDKYEMINLKYKNQIVCTKK